MVCASRRRLLSWLKPRPTNILAGSSPAIPRKGLAPTKLGRATLHPSEADSCVCNLQKTKKEQRGEATADPSLCPAPAKKCGKEKNRGTPLGMTACELAASCQAHAPGTARPRRIQTAHKPCAYEKSVWAAASQDGRPSHPQEARVVHPKNQAKNAALKTAALHPNLGMTARGDGWRYAKDVRRASRQGRDTPRGAQNAVPLPKTPSGAAGIACYALRVRSECGGGSRVDGRV
jgi:hypothetical protein